MKKNIILLVFLLPFLQSFSQNFDNDENSNIKTTRQGFGRFGGLDMGLGFVNSKGITEGTPYYFDEWDTEGIIFTKKNGRFKIKKVNINLYDNSLEAIYEENKIFTFDSNNLIRIVINGKVFRIFEIGDKLKIFELFFKDDFSIYRYHRITYAKKEANPMLARNVNKYIKKNKYYLYKNKELTMFKLSKKAFAKRFKSKTISEESIIDFIKKNKLSLKNEADLIIALKFVTKTPKVND